ncbi:hypothetical protein D018_1902B, partial [Vibrio parahaemolyticus VP2007-007]
IKQYYGT